MVLQDVQTQVRVSVMVQVFSALFWSRICLFCAVLLIIALPSHARESRTQEKAPNKTQAPSEFNRVLWTDLIPEDDLAALLNPPDYLADIMDGSPQDEIGSSLGTGNDRYQQALVSTRVVDAMDGEAVKIPGFVVPIEFDDDQIITQFFLVPYFGACIHEPPPPPNQIIFVDFPKGLKLNALYDPFWISGVLKTSIIDNGLATAAYTMEMYHYEAYTD